MILPPHIGGEWRKVPFHTGNVSRTNPLNWMSELCCRLTLVVIVGGYLPPTIKSWADQVNHISKRYQNGHSSSLLNTPHLQCSQM